MLCSLAVHKSLLLECLKSYFPSVRLIHSLSKSGDSQTTRAYGKRGLRENLEGFRQNASGTGKPAGVVRYGGTVLQSARPVFSVWLRRKKRTGDAERPFFGISQVHSRSDPRCRKWGSELLLLSLKNTVQRRMVLKFIVTLDWRHHIRR